MSGRQRDRLKCGSAVGEPLTHDPKIEGLIPAAAGAGREHWRENKGRLCLPFLTLPNVIL
jgi:hypothetical protein